MSIDKLNLNLRINNSETFQLSKNTKKLIYDKLNEEMKLNFTEFIKLYEIYIKKY